MTQNPPSAVVPLRLADLSEEEFAAAVERGATLNVGQINALIGLAKIDRETLALLGIETRSARAATHIPHHAWPLLCRRLASHLLAIAGQTSARAGTAAAPRHQVLRLPADDSEGGAL
ncbi:hypothetical protein ABIC63_000537 [Pseudacidovorax sp. 1753]|uniref:hypothetical protein n=1 Tax=Pseudacidovorax sp. 1753 TaxID=3156419 RepID=UPI0033985FF5